MPSRLATAMNRDLGSGVVGRAPFRRAGRSGWYAARAGRGGTGHARRVAKKMTAERHDTDGDGFRSQPPKQCPGSGLEASSH